MFLDSPLTTTARKKMVLREGTTWLNRKNTTEINKETDDNETPLERKDRKKHIEAGVVGR